jgi:hypothetical protein
MKKISNKKLKQYVFPVLVVMTVLAMVALSFIIKEEEISLTPAQITSKKISDLQRANKELTKRLEICHSSK